VVAIDAHRFEAIFDDHGAAVLSFLLRRTERAAAEDALSETFLVAWRRRNELPAEPLPWLYAVARNVLANQRKADGRRAALVQRLRRERSGGLAGPEHRSVDGDAPLVRALRTLAPADQEVLLLDAWEQLSSTEAGEVLGCSAEAFRARLSRARGRLRRAVARPIPDDAPSSADGGASASVRPAPSTSSTEVTR
jgi:RNA polymerase sigma factor (sigma-70 family)